MAGVVMTMGGEVSNMLFSIPLSLIMAWSVDPRHELRSIHRYLFVVLRRLSSLLFFLHGLLRRLLLLLHRLLLLAAQAGKTGIRADESASGMKNCQNQEGEHHRESVERVRIRLVERDRIGESDATSKFRDAVDDTDLDDKSQCELHVLNGEERR